MRGPRPASAICPDSMAIGKARISGVRGKIEAHERLGMDTDHGLVDAAGADDCRFVVRNTAVDLRIHRRRLGRQLENPYRPAAAGGYFLQLRHRMVFRASADPSDTPDDSPVVETARRMPTVRLQPQGQRQRHLPRMRLRLAQANCTSVKHRTDGALFTDGRLREALFHRGGLADGLASALLFRCCFCCF